VSADDHRLIAECLHEGNALAFGELIRRYQDRLFNSVFRILGNVEDAQDAVQETFLNAFRSLDSFKGDAEFFTWLYRIAWNTAVSLKRKQRVVLSLHGDRNGHAGIDPLDGSDGNQPGHALEKAEQERRVQDALTRLSPEHRTVLVLKEIENQKYETIAEILDLPVGTIRSRIHRARMELREILERDEEQE